VPRRSCSTALPLRSRARRGDRVVYPPGGEGGTAKWRRAQGAEARRAEARARRVPQPTAEAVEPPAPRFSPSAAAPAQLAPTGGRQRTPGGQPNGGNRERTDRDDDTDPA
jgi:hypothetical protein